MDSIFLVWITKYCGYNATWALTMNSIYSSPEERGRNQTEDAELKGIHRQMDMSEVKLH